MIYLCVTVAVVGILWFAWFTAPLEMHRPTGRPMTRAEVEDLVVKLIVEKLDEWNINKRRGTGDYVSSRKGSPKSNHCALPARRNVPRDRPLRGGLHAGNAPGARGS